MPFVQFPGNVSDKAGETPQAGAQGTLVPAGGKHWSDKEKEGRKRSKHQQWRVAGSELAAQLGCGKFRLGEEARSVGAVEVEQSEVVERFFSVGVRSALTRRPSTTLA